MLSYSVCHVDTYRIISFPGASFSSLFLVAMFRIRGFKSQYSEFDYAATFIAPEFAVEDSDLITHRPTALAYHALKRELNKRTQASEQQRLHQLLMEEELAGRKPFQLLRCLSQLQRKITLQP